MYNSRQKLSAILLEIKELKDELNLLTNDPDSYLEQFTIPEHIDEIKNKGEFTDKLRIYHEEMVKDDRISLAKRLHELELIRDKLLLQQQESAVPQCSFQNDTLLLKLNDGTQKAIAFDTRRQTRNMAVIFSVLYRHWQANGEKPIPKSEIISATNKDLRIDINSNFVKDTISNIRKSKIRPANLQNMVSIKYDRDADGYSLSIKSS